MVFLLLLLLFFAGRQLPLRSVHISVVKPSIYMRGAEAEASTGEVGHMENAKALFTMRGAEAERQAGIREISSSCVAEQNIL